MTCVDAVAFRPQSDTLDEISTVDLRQYASNVAHAPMIDDLAASDAKDVAGREAQAFPSRRHAVQHALMNA